MKTILITAYAVNPYIGSEDTMGWHMLLQAARFNYVIAVTRRNNRLPIERYLQEHPEERVLLRNIRFLYFDWPTWITRWEKGPLLKMWYYYVWQLTLIPWLWMERDGFDIVHNLNVSNDWTPTFLWMLGKPLVWGQIGHQPQIPRQFLLPVYGWRAYLKDRAGWSIKQLCWHADPFLWLARKKAARIICMNSEAAKRLHLKNNFILHPSVATDETIYKEGEKDKFRVLSVGRFVPVKGFDLTIKSFAQFYHNLSNAHQQRVQLVLAGSGPLKSFLQGLVKKEKIEQAVVFIEWMPREKVAALYRLAAAFLFPSHEAAGRVVPEAMSYNLPVVCLQNCGAGEFIHPQSTLSVPVGGYDATVANLAAKLQELYFRPALYHRERYLSMHRYWQLFRWNVRGEMLRQLYEEVG
ncbi:glycosyltransferase family 4 protein [Chitinophaga agrisoli]|uniref:Glycosyltransferase family 4 protein n=1 Tax=Chitinophaga agrisoli TaxID=2607653 RepID=A0A5B2VS44_9BACT|nr:glycosyltransferase family 4 protein [Chitinophaga agrisoli]KAA2242583.1 glycosyltransferase family 4 protein [Chitinophaga agrisoli]